MTLSDQDFIDSYILHIPAAYSADDTTANKVIYALANIGKGTTLQVHAELQQLEPGNNIDDAEIKNILEGIYQKGLIKGYQENGEMYYDTSKKLRPNDGKVNVNLLDPDADR